MPECTGDAQCPPGQCAVVRDTQGTVVNSFCSAEGGPRQYCASVMMQCQDAEHGNTYTEGNPPWYQAALDWAKENGAADVYLEPGAITIGGDSVLPATWPFLEGVGVHVPSGIVFHGSENRENPTVINVGEGASLSALILAAEARESLDPVDGGEVHHLVLVGTDQAGYGAGEDCPAQALDLTSVDEFQLGELPEVLAPRAAVGIQVGEATEGSNPVNTHHLIISHVGLGIGYGWNTAVEPETPNCETNSCVTFSLTQAAQCPGADHAFDLQLPGDGQKHHYCINVNQVANCTPLYCNTKPHEYIGTPGAHTQIYNNSVCDANVGINVAGGYVDVHHNTVLRSFAQTGNFGISPDGHVPYSASTNWYHNFVHGYGMGFLTDGSQYLFISDDSFKAATGYERSDFVDYQDVLWLQQIILDLGSQHLINTDPYRGMVDDVTVRDNRIMVTEVGINLYRVTKGDVGFNDVRTLVGTGDTGVGVINTINSYVYGNTIDNFDRGIVTVGSPGHSSLWGSCYNGLGYVFDEMNGTMDYPNNFSNVACNKFFGANHCFENAPAKNVCQP